MDKPVNVLSSEEEENDGSLPKIVSSVSLQGCLLSFNNELEENWENGLSPSCELKDRSFQNKGENKRAELKHVGDVEHKKAYKSRPSTSKSNNYSHHVVDTKRLALQESVFKTKELFDNFLRVCKDQENGDEMEKVVQKLTRAYERTRQDYLGSEAFQNILNDETNKVNSSSVKPWLNMKLILDEMKHNKRLLVSKPKSGESEESQQDRRAADSDEPIIECPKKRRHLKKLEKTLRAVNLKIKSLEERDVDWDEDEDSAYLKLDRYRAHFIKVYNKVCEIKGKLPDADRPYMRKVSFAGTTYPHINRCIERFYNKHRRFPDFLDIKELVKMALEEENIVMAPIKVHEIAMNAFKEFGEMLKRLRQYDDYDVMISYLDHHVVDPARDNKELQDELNRNAIIFKKKEQEVIDRFAEKGSGLLSGDGNSSDNSQPKRKKKKIFLKSPRKNEDELKRTRSSSSEISEEEKVKHFKRKDPPNTLSSSEDSDGEHEPTDGEKSEVEKSVRVDKGKTLIGKKRIIKKGVPKKSPLKHTSKSNINSIDESCVPVSSSEDSDGEREPTDGKQSEVEQSVRVDKGKTLIGKKRIIKKGVPKKSPPKHPSKSNTTSIDESCGPENTKDVFTDYLGLQVNRETKDKNGNVDKQMEIESDDGEILCLKEIKTPPVENPLTIIKGNHNSNSNNVGTSKSLNLPGTTSLNSNEKIGSTVQVLSIEDENDVPVLKIDDDSDAEPVTFKERACRKDIRSTKNLKKLSNKSNRSLSDDSNTGESSSISDEESEKRKSLSELELSGGSKEISSSSDSGSVKVPVIKESKPPCDADDAVIVLSEESEATNPSINKKILSESSQDSIDSDDVTILSQESPQSNQTTQKTNVVSNAKSGNSSGSYHDMKRLSTSNSNSTASRKRCATGNRPEEKTSTLGQTDKTKMAPIRKNPLNHSLPANLLDNTSSSNGNVKRQDRVPQVINGAPRKVIISRICRGNKTKNPQDSIPVIELD